MHPGFSVAELLISMMVVMLVATALVPIIGPKKVRNADPRYLHGVAECYYREGDGQLMYYYADNRSNRNAETHEVNDGFCTFDIPKAAHYEIFAIGAGSNGRGNDGSGIGANINPSNTAGHQGNIGIQSFADDTGALMRAALGSENDEMIPGRHFDEVVRESFTRWAARINYAGTADTMVPMMDEDDNWTVNNHPYRNNAQHNNGKYLYAQFNGITGPTGKPGGGFSEVRKSLDENYPNYGETCDDACTPLRKHGCPGYWEKPSGDNAPYWHFNDSTVAMNGIVPNHKCYVYLNYYGGDSDKPIGSDPNTPILFPFDGSSTGLSITPGWPKVFNNEGDNNPEDGKDSNLGISINARGGMNTLRLDGSAPGRNASEAGDGANGVNDIVTGNDISCTLTHGTNRVKYGLGNTNLTCNDFTIKDPDPNARKGLKHGKVGGYSSGGFQEAPSDGLEGNPGIANPNDAFSWSFSEPEVSISYGKAGMPGDVVSLSFAHLTGQLFLFPGRNHNGVITNSRVTSDSAGTHVVIDALSHPDNDGDIQEETYLLRDTDNAATPPQDLLDLAVPNYDKFIGYMNALRSVNQYGLRGGIYHDCIENNHCPGHAGPGAYPLVVDPQFRNELTLTNNQPYASTANYRNFRVYKRVFNGNGVNDPVCSEGYENPNKDNPAAQQYCTASNNTRRDGAVIIVW